MNVTSIRPDVDFFNADTMVAMSVESDFMRLNVAIIDKGIPSSFQVKMNRENKKSTNTSNVSLFGNTLL